MIVRPTPNSPPLGLDRPRPGFRVLGSNFLRLSRLRGIGEFPAPVRKQAHLLAIHCRRLDRRAVEFGGEALPRHQSQHQRQNSSHSLLSTQA